MAPRALASLRLWLQSSSLLAVLAGYSLLFAVGRGIASADRLGRHQELVATLSQELLAGRLSLPLPSGLGVEARWMSSASVEPPALQRQANDTVWLVSRNAVPSSGQRPRILEVRQNISTDLQRGQRDGLLLVAAAGVSVLFTSALLRLVIWRGLIQPLRRLTGQLELLEADSLGNQLLDPAANSSELHPIVEAFNQLQSRLALAWQRERRFVDGVAHELRTPITVISSHAQRLKAEASDNSKPASILIAAEAQRLAALLTVMLDFARADAGRLTLVLEPLDPELLLLDAFERLQALSAHRLTLAPAVQANLPVIQADADRVQQCLAALVENALRYSSGLVQLAVSASPDRVILHVRDQGSGIPIAEREQVLERFVRGSSSSGSQGSGIGLATANELMQAMQGELVIADAPGGGADLQLRFRISDRQPAP